MNLMLVFTEFEGLVGKDFEQGLVSLKQVVENLPDPKKDKDNSEGEGAAAPK